MAIKTEDIVNQEFSRAFLGYDMREVDEYLDALIDRFEQLEAQRKQMLVAMEYLLKRLEDTDDLPADVKKALSSGGKALQRLTAADADAETVGARGRKGAKAARRQAESGQAGGRRSAEQADGARAAKKRAIKQAEAEAAEAASADVTQRPLGKAPGASTRSALRVGHTRPEEAGTMEEPPAADGGRTAARQEDAAQRAQGEFAAETAGAQPPAPDVDALIPELLSDLESALSDGVIRAVSASKKDGPIRAEEERVP